MLLLRLFAILVVLNVFSVFSFAGDYVEVARPTGFRGMEWGTPLDDLPDLLGIKGETFKNSFFRQNEPLAFGDAKIESVMYSFRKNRLYRVAVAFKGRANHFLIKERLLSLYGRGRGVGVRYGWMWPDFSVEINYNDAADLGGLIYTYEGSLD